MVAYRLPYELIDLLEKTAAERKMTMTGAIEEAIALWLEQVCDFCGQTIPPGNRKELKRDEPISVRNVRSGH
jgi:hypothetical protein